MKNKKDENEENEAKIGNLNQYGPNRFREKKS